MLPTFPRLWRVTFTSLAIALTNCAAPLRGNSAGITPSANSDATPKLANKNLELFLLEQGFQGPVVAIYEQDQGVTPEVRSDTLVYEVPRDGVLRIAFPQPAGRRVIVAYRQGPSAGLRTFPSCYEMREKFPVGDRVGVCWLKELGATDAAAHESFIVTRWDGIPANYNRGMLMLDSLVFKGHFRGGLKWSEPTKGDQRSGRTATTSTLRTGAQL